MAMMKKSMLALALAGIVAAQSSVVSVFFPDSDEQALVGSIIHSDASKTTLAVSCPSGEDQNSCGFADSITVTVGPSTFRAQESFESLTVELDCVITGTTAATCKETFVGPADLIDSDADGTSLVPASETAAAANTQITTTAITTTLASSDIAYIPVTITTGSGASGSGASSSASASASAASATGSSTATSTSGSSTSSGSATPSSNSNSGAGKTDARLLALGATGAGFIGLIIALL
ncbi:hypothetical protein A1O3_05441 [Capronia epimyces CBS 606.96]|uniref:GPI anchored protein n=1 Tax=Capronia epimyces CBS 606.96 TaxID=1182542 RepID=W9YR69_9EURO|nr:uncharacterized protein A1O3_05441 [Capronia epimyces CBS 606.96]EXJ84769.1 hypothetical protein A1O3_05441 [Capronia epimyces CBS 606.96]